jgi:hypothetical protein
LLRRRLVPAYGAPAPPLHSKNQRRTKGTLEVGLMISWVETVWVKLI